MKSLFKCLAVTLALSVSNAKGDAGDCLFSEDFEERTASDTFSFSGVEMVCNVIFPILENLFFRAVHAELF